MQRRMSYVCVMCVCVRAEGACERVGDSACATGKSLSDVSGTQTGAYWRSLYYRHNLGTQRAQSAIR
eukprot:6178242-Pleurochrysis_carterae.AAC.1